MLPFFEDRRCDYRCNQPSQIDFPAHLHTAAEVFYVLEGVVEVLVDSQQRILTPGDLAIIFPGKAHAYHTVTPGRSILAIISDTLAPKVCSVLKEKQPKHPFVDSGTVVPQLAAELEELAATSDEMLGRSLAQLILTRLACQLPLEDRPVKDADNLKYQALSILGRDYRTPLSIRGLAQQVGVSECHLSRALHEQSGMGFRAYINSLRVADAQLLLTTTDRSVLEIALECGFENLRTFNRAFAEISGCSPREYRRRN